MMFLQRIRELISSDKVRQVDKLRLVMLYAVRYESHSNNDVSGLVEALKRKGLAEEFRSVSSCNLSFNVFFSVMDFLNEFFCELNS